MPARAAVVLMDCRARTAAATLLADLTTLLGVAVPPPASSVDTYDAAVAHAYQARRRGVGDAIPRSA